MMKGEFCMITSFNTELYDLTGQMNAIVLNDINILDKKPIQVYIPKIMPNIPKGEAKISIIRTKGYSVFKNANMRPALTGINIQEKNYFETSFNATSNIDDLDKVTKNIIKELNASLFNLPFKNSTLRFVFFLISYFNFLSLFIFIKSFIFAN